MKLKLLVGLVCLIFIFGCSGFGTKQKFSDQDFRVGTKGLDIKILPNSPPSEVYASDDFSGDSLFTVSAMLSNKGAYNILSGILVFGFEDDYVELKQWDVSNYGNIQISPEQNKIRYTLEGKSIGYPDGEKAMVSLTAKALSLEKLSTTHETFVTFTTCYKYMTNAYVPICINNPQYNLYSNVESCKSQKVIKESGQGGPVTVTEVEPLIGSDEQNKLKPVFLITVKNKGKGQVVDFFKTEDACSSTGLLKDDIDIVYVEASLGNRELICSPNALKLKKSTPMSKDVVKCTFKEGLNPGELNFETPLNVKIHYGYTESFSKKITVNKITYNK